MKVQRKAANCPRQWRPPRSCIIPMKPQTCAAFEVPTVEPTITGNTAVLIVRPSCVICSVGALAGSRTFRVEGTSGFMELRVGGCAKPLRSPGMLFPPQRQYERQRPPKELLSTSSTLPQNQMPRSPSTPVSASSPRPFSRLSSARPWCQGDLTF